MENRTANMIFNIHTRYALVVDTAEIVEVLGQDGTHKGEPTFTVLKKTGETLRNQQDIIPHLPELPTIIRTPEEFAAVFPLIQKIFEPHGDARLGAIDLARDLSHPKNTTVEIVLLQGWPCCDYGYLVAMKMNCQNGFRILINDHDDGYVCKEYANQNDRDAEWDLLLQTAPHTFASLTKLGFKR